MSGKRREDRHCHSRLEIGRHLAGEQLDELRQLGWQLRRNISVDSRLLGGLLGKMILAGSLYSLLYQIRNRSRLRHLAGILYGGERLRLVFAKGFYYLLDPRCV